MSTLQTLTTHPVISFSAAAPQDSFWCLTCSQPEAVLVTCPKHTLPPAVPITLKTNCPPGCCAGLSSLYPTLTPHPHTQSSQLPPKALSNAAPASLLLSPSSVSATDPGYSSKSMSLPLAHFHSNLPDLAFKLVFLSQNIFGKTHKETSLVSPGEGN